MLAGDPESKPAALFGVQDDAVDYLLLMRRDRRRSFIK
jgi:hypothetical protein